MKSAAKVGLLLVVFVVLFAVGYSVLGRSLFAPQVDTYYALFEDAGGLTPGTRVLLAGVKVGTITKIELKGPRRARMTLTLSHDTPVPQGSVATIPGSLIGLGDTPLNIVPPDASGAGTEVARLPVGSVLEGRKAGPLDALLPNGGKDLYGELNQTLVAVRRLLENKDLQNDLRRLAKTTDQTLLTSQATLRSFDRLATRGTALLDRNQATIDGILASTRNTLADVHESANTIATLLKSGKLQNGATELLAKANGLAAQSGRLLASLDRTINDAELQRDLRTAARNAAATSERGPAIADNTQKITENVAAITESSKELPGKLGTLADKASKLEDQISDLTQKVSNLIGRRPSGGTLPNVTFGLDLFRESNPGYWRTDLGARIGIKNGFVDLGLRDAFESNLLVAQLGQNASPSVDYRYGIYGGKAGVGVDYRVFPRLSLRTDLWDLNTPRLDARLRYDLGKGLVGWFGVDRILHDNALTVGLGIRR